MRTKEVLNTLPDHIVADAVKAALAEDLGAAGDITTQATIPLEAHTEAAIALREDGVIGGIDVARRAFHTLDTDIEFVAEVPDGARAKSGSIVARVSGNARAILTAERVALNFLGRMSGIATLTSRYVDAVKGTNANIVDTRKTTPGLRAFEKYAIRCGGGRNHRSGLFDAVLIKDNHIAAAGGIEAAVAAARDRVGHMIKIEVEVDTLDQLEAALRYDIDAVLLDNMPPSTVEKAVKMVSGRVVTEASGGINLDTVAAIARTGVDIISVGALTHSAAVLDFGLDFSS